MPFDYFRQNRQRKWGYFLVAFLTTINARKWLFVMQCLFEIHLITFNAQSDAFVKLWILFDFADLNSI